RAPASLGPGRPVEPAGAGAGPGRGRFRLWPAPGPRARGPRAARARSGDLVAGTQRTTARGGTELAVARTSCRHRGRRGEHRGTRRPAGAAPSRRRWLQVRPVVKRASRSASRTARTASGRGWRPPWRPASWPAFRPASSSWRSRAGASRTSNWVLPWALYLGGEAPSLDRVGRLPGPGPKALPKPPGWRAGF